MGTIVAIDDPSKLADVVVTHLNVKLEDKQKRLLRSTTLVNGSKRSIR